MIKKDSLFIKLVGINILTIVIITIFLSTISFYTSKKLIIKTFTESSAITLEQVSNNLIEFHNQIVNISNSISLNNSLKKYLGQPVSNESDTLKRLHDITTYYQSFSLLLNYYNLTLTTVGVNGMSYTSNGDSLILPLDSEIQDYLSMSPSGVTPISYSAKENGITSLTSNNPVIIASKVLTDVSTNDLYGVLFLSINEADFRKLFTQTTVSNNTLSILSKEGTLLSSSPEHLLGNSIPDLYSKAVKIVENQLPYENIKIDNTEVILLAKYVPYLDFYIINTIDKNIALHNVSYIKSFIFIFSCIFIFITIIWIFLISNRISKPLIKLIDAMVHVSEGHFDKQAYIDGSYEVRILGSTFNTMLSKLDLYIQKLMKEQEERRKAELYALQMQIHPHFLYNTLSAIKYLAWQGQTHKVGSTIDALISLLQNTLGKVDECISVDEEIENLKNYIIIIQTRYGDAIQVSFDIHPKCLDYVIPKLILQPFVENAFFHAFNLSQKGTILISIREANHMLICEIIDNGDGMADEQVELLTNKEGFTSKPHKKHFTGIGINNVDERIKLLYGKDYGITVISKLHYGTCIRITLPLEK